MVVLEQPRRLTSLPLREWRCRQCRRLLMLVRLAAGSIIECQCRCGVLNVLTVDLYTQEEEC
jgi:phage FluMu protein Com